MENLEKKSLTQKLKQNSKNILYSLALLIISGLLIAYASKKIDSLNTNIIATSGDELSYEWVNKVNTELKYLRDKVDGGTVVGGGTQVSCGSANGSYINHEPSGTELCTNGAPLPHLTYVEPTHLIQCGPGYSIGGTVVGCGTSYTEFFLSTNNLNHVTQSLASQGIDYNDKNIIFYGWKCKSSGGVVTDFCSAVTRK